MKTKVNPSGLLTVSRKGTLLTVLALAGCAVPCFAAGAADVTSAITGVAADASSGVTAGVAIGAVVFGAKVVWGAIKSMAH